MEDSLLVMDKAPIKHSAELATAEQDEWKRRVVDDAKKRAVTQREDYETFKNLVSVAHLKPIGAAGDADRAAAPPAWGFGADGSTRGTQRTEGPAIEDGAPTEAPASAPAFERDWRRRCPTPLARLTYLRLCGPATLAAIFKVELSAALLGDALAAIEAGLAAGDVEPAEAHALLAALAGAGRFSLNVRLLAGPAKKAKEAVFARLDGVDGVAETAKAYGMK